MVHPSVGGAAWTRLQAHAKVNLALAVTGRRPDGYHELRSVFLRLDLADTVSLHDADASGSTDVLTVEGDPDCPVSDNLVRRAIEAYRGAALVASGIPIPPIAMSLSKVVPMAAGLAGGSSDAAAALRLLDARYAGALPDGSLQRLALSIGADVPFFLDGAGAALVSGIGAALEPLPPPIEPLCLLLVVPSGGAPTPRVFAAWDVLPAPGPGAAASVEVLAATLRAGATPRALVDLAPILRDANDLWQPASTVVPALGPLRAWLESVLQRPVLLTGSGSTLFAVYASGGEAADAAHALRTMPPAAGSRILVTSSTGPYVPAIEQGRDP